MVQLEMTVAAIAVAEEEEEEEEEGHEKEDKGEALWFFVYSCPGGVSIERESTSGSGLATSP